MEDVKLYVELVGVDPASGADIRIARRESTSWHKDIVAELINQVLRCGATLIIVAVLTACDDRQVSYFPDYAAIPEQSGIWTWLPVFFPSSASEIEMTFNLDSNLFMLTLAWPTVINARILKACWGRRAWFIMPTFLIKAGVKRGKLSGIAKRGQNPSLLPK